MQKNKKAFTLVELVVVMAIIGIVAAILVPLITNYTRKAAAKTDMANAKKIHERVIDTLTTDIEAYDSFYKHNTATVTVVCKDSNGSTECYDVTIVCKADGAKNSRNDCKDKFIGGNKEAQTFINALNANFHSVSDSGEYLVPMKRTTHKNGNVTNRWMVCYRKDDPDKIEIWVSDAASKWAGCELLYRLYPSPDVEYTG